MTFIPRLFEKITECIYVLYIILCFRKTSRFCVYSISNCSQPPLPSLNFGVNIFGLARTCLKVVRYQELAASPLASRGFAPRGMIISSITYTAEKMRMDRKFSLLKSEFAKFVKIKKNVRPPLFILNSCLCSITHLEHLTGLNLNMF